MNETASLPIILVVDDDAGQRSLLQSFLNSQSFTVITATNGTEALQILAEKSIDMMVCDVRMPGITGIETMQQAREKYPHLPVLMVTAYADIHDAVNAMRDGAVNYLEKPIDLDELKDSVCQALGLQQKLNNPKIDTNFNLPDNIIAPSTPMQQLFREIALVAPSDSRILITGESGTGKEVIANLVHLWSTRTKKPFIKVNCAAIPEALLESELFGHTKGSFTGASQDRIGRFEEANHGTILLDEIAEMPMALQAKLLRVTQEGTFQKIGSNKDIKVDVRILAATNKNLEKEVAAKRFREDLFYRLNVIELYLPPLRDRKADIIPLANYFTHQFSNGKKHFSASVASMLSLYQWSGNVRELRNALERAVLMARGDLILPEHLPRRIQDTTPDNLINLNDNDGNRIEEMERIVILQALKEKKYNRTETAKSLGISRRALIYKLQKFSQEGYATEK